MKNFFATTAIALCFALPAGAEDYQPDPNAKSGGNIVVTYKDDVAKRLIRPLDTTGKTGR